MRWGWLAAVAALALLVAPPPSPVHLSYATSDSMEPAIDEGDGYLLVSTGDYDPGDVVTFRSEQRGAFVTHRVVERTDGGLVTRGDDNPSTDQAGGLPPVEREQVLGEIPQVGGMLLVVPNLGAVVGPLQTNPAVGLGVVGLLGALWLVGGRDRRTRTRSVTHVDEVLGPVFAVGVFGALALLVLVGGTTYAFQYTAVDGDPTAADELAVGDPAERTYEVRLFEPPLTRTFVEADGMAVTDRTSEGTTTTLTVRVPPPAEPGTVETAVRTYAYPATLPADLQRTLHETHPALATVASVGAVFLPLYLLYLLAVDGSAPLRPPRWRPWHLTGGDRR
jgi:signal peptidase